MYKKSSKSDLQTLSIPSKHLPFQSLKILEKGVKHVQSYHSRHQNNELRFYYFYPGNTDLFKFKKRNS